jgi:threonine dehydrogenase-like Zn-dependent dehydrogenase
MRAAILYGPHDFRIEEKPMPVITPDECLIQIKACGVCHSEIHQWRIRIPGLEYPRHIGHEVAGEIIQAGEAVTGWQPGDRVAVWVDGRGYAEQIAVKSDRIFPIAADIPYECALAEPIACATNGLMRAGVQFADTIALVGTGFMGLIMLQELAGYGAKDIIAIDIREELLLLARKLGATRILNPLKDDVPAVIKEWTRGMGVDVAFEIGGAQSTLDLAADICRMEGKLVIFGYHPGPRQIKDLGYWNWMAFDIINAHFRDLNTILRGTRIGMELLNMKKIDMAPLVTHRFPMEEIETAFCTADEKPAGFVKSVLVFE